MTVRARLVLLGAVLPTLALALAIGVAGRLFRAAQLDDLDRRLLALAAAESVGLFDGPDGSPHVHIPRSPIAENIADLATAIAIYDAGGERVAREADPGLAPDRVPLVGPANTVRLATATVAGVERRVLELPVEAPDRRLYTLWIGASLAPLEATMDRFYRATLSALALLAAAMLAIQLVVARRLAGRISAMTAFVPGLSRGDTDLPPDPIADELGALRETLRAVAGRLAAARVEQDRLLASAAHELRSPLTRMRTELDLALRRDRPAVELRRALATVRDEVVRLADLAGALLDLQTVRHVGFERSPGDLARLVRDACAAHANVAEAAGVELRVIAPASAPASFDDRGLRQVVDNLLGNALRHATPGTAVEMLVESTSSAWILAVTDRGPGIPADETERIFAPFHRLAADGPGSGLGLAIAREVVERHGGRVYVDPAHTPGARFVVELPA